MNSKSAKILRKFAAVQELNYTNVKNYFQTLSVARQRIDLSNMKIVIKKGGENKMAVQKTCDRPHGVVIGANDDYLPVTIPQPTGEARTIDLCKICGDEFVNGFLKQNPTNSVPGAEAAQAAAAQPAAPAVPVDPNANNVPQQ